MPAVETHVHVGLDDDGDPVMAFKSLDSARDAVDSDAHRYADVVDYWPDVPLMAEGAD